MLAAASVPNRVEPGHLLRRVQLCRGSLVADAEPRFAEAYLQRSKTDALDATSILELARRMEPGIDPRTRTFSASIRGH